ncbi:hypothetical protein [Micromonospora sp. KLBMP9576]|uniref:hypothetical protein n=1 Tax=Micromonospora sp. KLBMP9576 TaxID=3424769 RepID=UPI003D90ABB8
MQPADDGEGGVVYERLYEEYMEGEERAPTASTLAYAEALAERRTFMTEGRSSGGGSLLNDASGPMIYLTMPYGLAGKLSAEAARLADRHGLVCYDSQTEHLRPVHDD